MEQTCPLMPPGMSILLFWSVAHQPLPMDQVCEQGLYCVWLSCSLHKQDDAVGRKNGEHDLSHSLVPRDQDWHQHLFLVVQYRWKPSMYRDPQHSMKAGYKWCIDLGLGPYSCSAFLTSDIALKLNFLVTYFFLIIGISRPCNGFSLFKNISTAHVKIIAPWMKQFKQGNLILSIFSIPREAIFFVGDWEMGCDLPKLLFCGFHVGCDFLQNQPTVPLPLPLQP